jgi:hypothetical protein
MANGNGKETVTLRTSYGDQDFVVPSGLSDAEVKTLALSKRPDLFKSQESFASDAAMQAHQQMQAGATAPGLQQTQRAMQFGGMGTPQFVDVPAGTAQAYQQAQQQAGQTGGKIGAALTTLPAIAAEPAKAGASLVTGYATGKAGKFLYKSGAQALGASPETAEKVGNYAEMIGNIIGGGAGAKGMGQLEEAFGPKALQAQGVGTVEKIKKIAGFFPVDTGNARPIAMDLIADKEAGAQLPMAARRLVLRMRPGEPPITLEEARLFQKNISALSVNERNALKEDTAWKLRQLNRGLQIDIDKTAQNAGFDPNTFTGAIGQMHQGYQNQGKLDWLKEFALKTAGKTAGGIAEGGGIITAAKIAHDYFGIDLPGFSKH